MIKRWPLALALAFVSLLGWLAWKGLPQRQPIHAGKPLSFWLKGFDIGYNDPRKPNYNESVEAVREAGTNAIPILLRMLRSRDSDLSHRLTRLIAKQRLIKIDYVTADRQRCSAWEGFGALGLSAKPAIPELATIAQQEISRVEWNKYATEILDRLRRTWPREASNDVAKALEAATQGAPSQALSKKTQRAPAPNPQGGAIGRQSVDSDTERASDEAASRRSPLNYRLSGTGGSSSSVTPGHN